MGRPPQVRALLVMLAITLGLNVGILAALLFRLGGQTLPNAILEGGAAFGGTVGLVILIMDKLELL